MTANDDACRKVRVCLAILDTTPELAVEIIRLVQWGSVLAAPQQIAGADHSPQYASLREAVRTNGAVPQPAAATATAAVPADLVLSNGSAPSNGIALSSREETILHHLMTGASNKHIARELDISEATIKTHVKSLLRKLRLGNRTQAAVWGKSHLSEPTAAAAARQ